MRLLTALLVVLLTAGTAWAFTPGDWAKQTATISSSGQAHTGDGYFKGMICTTQTAPYITVNMYDNTAASGKKLLPTDLVLSTDSTYGVAPGVVNVGSFPVHFVNGIYLDVSAKGAYGCMVYYK